MLGKFIAGDFIAIASEMRRFRLHMKTLKYVPQLITRIIQSLYYAPAGRYINAWMHSLKNSVRPEILNRYDLWVLRHKIGGAKEFVNNVQWRDQMM